MQEVAIRLCFTKECLGFAERRRGSGGVIYEMPRNGTGAVVFLPSWWKSRLEYAAKVRNMLHKQVQQIDWASEVDGPVTTWRRYTQRGRNGRDRYALHEAFRPGTTVGVNAVIPHGVTTDDLHELLTVVGVYKGMSPYQTSQETYGTFDVVSVLPVIRRPDE